MNNSNILISIATFKESENIINLINKIRENYPITKILIINDDDIKNIKSTEISNFIDCGYMNEEIYVDYINRIFDSSLSIKIIFSDKKLNDKDVVFVDFNYTFKSKETGTTWRFSTAKSKDLLVGNPVYDDNPYRECSSTQKLESSLRNVLEYQL